MYKVRSQQVSLIMLSSFLVLLFIVGSASMNRAGAQEKEGIVFFEGTWKEAVAQAQKENKPIFMDVYATWCGPCKQLQKHTFTNKETALFYNTHFINISFDGERGEGRDIAAALRVSAYPTLFFFDKNGKPVLYTLGFQQPKDLIEAGKAALEKLKGTS